MMQSSMQPNTLILGAAAVGLVVNTLAVLAVAWKGGYLLGQVESTLKELAKDGEVFRVWKDGHAELIARVVQQLDSLEARVKRLEDAPVRAR
jgi:DNA-binding helix-hairpin-helix protein with protein kinase domain